MDVDITEGVTDVVSAENAFGALGNPIRVDVLRVLGDADDPLAFSVLYDRVDVNDSGQFNYHLDKLVGHFVRKTDDGYALARPGRRVVEAVLAGTVTGKARLERTPVDETCEYCGSTLTVEWRDESVELYCTGCAGRYRQTHGGKPRGRDADSGYLGRLLLPPAGLADRDPDAVLDAAWRWTMSEVQALAGGICPRCSAAIDRTVLVCPDHRADERQCPNCAREHAVGVRFDCSNCILQTGGSAVLAFAMNTELLAFLTDHGLNPLSPDAIGRLNETYQNYEEDIRATDPLDARFVFTADGDSLVLRVDGDLSIVETTRRDSGR